MTKRRILAAFLLLVAFPLAAQQENATEAAARPNGGKAGCMTPATWQADGVCADSISIMLRHLARTNEELQNVNANLRLHSQIALGSIGSMALSAGCFALMANIEPSSSWYVHVEQYENYKTALTVAGITFGVAGCIGVITSYFPTLNGKIKCDGKRLTMIL